MRIQRAGFGELSSTTVYEILRLRSEVFVVEQACAYLDIDGRDAAAEHWWIERDGRIDSYLRTLREEDGAVRIGRVVTPERARRQGLAALLLERALEDTNPPWRLAAQSYLVPWYERFGFTVCGEEFDEDGIMHTPMERLSR